MVLKLGCLLESPEFFFFNKGPYVTPRPVRFWCEGRGGVELGVGRWKREDPSIGVAKTPRWLNHTANYRGGQKILSGFSAPSYKSEQTFWPTQVTQEIDVKCFNIWMLNIWMFGFNRPGFKELRLWDSHKLPGDADATSGAQTLRTV